MAQNLNHYTKTTCSCNVKPKFFLKRKIVNWASIVQEKKKIKTKNLKTKTSQRNHQNQNQNVLTILS